MASVPPSALREALQAPPGFTDEETEAKKCWAESSSLAGHSVSVHSSRATAALLKALFLGRV